MHVLRAVCVASLFALACGGGGGGGASPDGSGAPTGPTGPTGTTGTTGTTGPTACTDTVSDPANCGTCGNTCKPSHAAPRCAQGSCDRGACEPGYFDLDANRANGCEASCTGASCTLPDGAAVALSAPPIPETGQVAWTFASTAPEDLAVAPDAPVAVMGAAAGWLALRYRSVWPAYALHLGYNAFAVLVAFRHLWW